MDKLGRTFVLVARSWEHVAVPASATLITNDDFERPSAAALRPSTGL